MTSSAYCQTYCFRIQDHRRETEIVAEACRLGGFPEYRRDCVDIFIPETPALTGFLLLYQQSLIRLGHMDYRVAK